ncbi:cell division inhibitor SulA [Marinobacterium arenosum]|uniref:cell division inhibitor SulA n=1 Tax=Marinobacterium arenosum TaxID=2862496 RepID=UPI001C93892E|nr:SulA-like leucine-rich domain-containing protein [Marinobacterium arenosum]MBY4676933.1 cell division inhibitor [Marinobacterium arenosum]
MIGNNSHKLTTGAAALSANRQSTLGTASGLAGKVTEIVLHDHDISQMPILLPLLAQLSRDQRWFVWVAPPKLLPKALLAEAGIDLSKVLLLHPSKQRSEYQLACQALAAGTCHAVVTWPGYLCDEQLKGLEAAASQGASHGIVIRRRQDA